jgi:hypothetical protein
VANCDEFIFYDDLVRESRRAKREASNETKPAVKRSPEEERARRDEMDKRRNQAVEIAVNTFEALVLERGDSGKIWASVLKEAIKRRKPDFSESYYGFRTFGNLIEECKARGLLEFGRDDKSGAYVYRGSGVPTAGGSSADASGADGMTVEAQEGGKAESRRSRGRGRTAAERFAERQAERLAQQARAPQESDEPSAIEIDAEDSYVEPEQLAGQPEVAEVPAAAPAGEGERGGRGRGRGNRGGRGNRQDGQGGNVAPAAAVAEAPVVLEAAIELPVAAEPAPAKKKSGAKPPARKLKTATKPKTENTRQAKGGNGAGEQPAAAAPAPAPVEAAPAPADAGASPAEAAAAKPAKAKAAAKPARKPAARTPRPAKAKAALEE